MKFLLTIAAALFIYSLNVAADEAGPKEKRLRSGAIEDLLSPAVAYAIEVNDIQMLEMLSERNWDFSKDLSAPDGVPHAIWVGRPPLWYALLLQSKQVVEWLVKSGRVSIDDVSRKGTRPADLLLYEPVTKESESLHTDIVKIVKRNDDGGEAKALKEFVRHMSDFESSSEWPIVVSVNGSPAQNKWLQMLKPVAKVVSGIVPESDLSGRHLEISWRQAKGGGYECRFNFRNGVLSGHGLKGKMFSRYGYWFLRVDESWES